MKRIKDIIAAIKTLGLDPVAMPKDAVTQFDNMTDGSNVDLDESDKVRIRVLRQIMDSVLIIAEDEEKKAAAPEVKA